MGILDALFGHKDETPQNTGQAPQPMIARRAQSVTPSASRPSNADEQALARYRYMLQTAPPEDLERAHQEAFARLTPEQRQMVLGQMSQIVPQNEAAHLTDDPRDLARAATRAELRQPGAMQRMFGGANQMGGMGMMGGQPMMGGGMGGGMMGGMAGSLLTSIAGGFIGSSIANTFFNHSGNEQMFQGSPEAQAVEGGMSNYGDVDYSGDNFAGDNFAGDNFAGDYQTGGLDSSADPYGDPGVAMQDTGLDSSADPYGDPGVSDGFADTSFADTGFDSGDSGGFDGGGFDSSGDF